MSLLTDRCREYTHMNCEVTEILSSLARKKLLYITGLWKCLTSKLDMTPYKRFGFKHVQGSIHIRDTYKRFFRRLLAIRVIIAGSIAGIIVTALWSEHLEAFTQGGCWYVIVVSASISWVWYDWCWSCRQNGQIVIMIALVVVSSSRCLVY